MGNPLNALYQAVAWVLTQIYNFLSPIFGPTSGWTWALTIVILVVAMRLIMVPLFIKQMHTTRKMTSLQPQMAALRKRYKGDKQTLNQETMKLYQEAGVNPLMGCLPVVAQLPLFFSLFSVLRAIAYWVPGQVPKYGMPLAMVRSAKQAKILGVSIADKVLFAHGLYVPFHAKVVIVGAVVVSMITTYLTVRQSMKRGMMPAATPDNPMGQSQKYMAYIMPFFALTGLYWPFGLVLYWVTTNLWTLVQQWALFKRYPYTPPSADGTVTPAPAVGGVGARALAPRAGRASPAVNGSGAGQAGDNGGVAQDGKAPGGKVQNGKVQNGKVQGGKPQGGKVQSSKVQGATTPSAATGGATAGGGTSGGGMLRKLGRGRSEPEPPPEAPEAKLVRQQRQRQSRSKRSGKR
ncbi:MAG TPA: membrane protein insertase YidC [Streptosporangiaceae bacterium]